MELSTRVVIVRHGQSSFNVEQKIQGRCDESVLTERGAADAHRVGDVLRGSPADAIYSSPLQRARQTAEILQAYLPHSPPLQTTERLLEVDLPLWEGLTKQQVRERFPDDYRRWHQQPHELAMRVSGPEGKRLHYPVLALYEQAQQFWQMLLARHRGQTIVLVAHNGINRCAISSAIGIPPSRYHTIQQTNCGLSVLNFSGGWGDPVQLESLNQTAHLDLPLPPPREQRGLRLLLVRHGETDWNRSSRFQGQIDIPLNTAGREQARKAADLLQDTAIDFGVSSPLLRPKETAEIALAHHPSAALQLESGLTEIGHGRWEGKLQAEIEAEYGELLQRWKSAPETVQMPDGENLQQVWDRAIAAWQGIVREAAPPPEAEFRTGLVVAHDAINKVILCHLLGLTPAHFWHIKQGNGAISTIDYPQGAEGWPVLQAINLTSHLSQDVFDHTAAGAL